MNRDISSIRKDYQLASLDEASTAANPIDQFEHWWEDAIQSNIDEVNAFVLSTVNANGTPSSRVVLLKGFTPEGFVFFTYILKKEIIMGYRTYIGKISKTEWEKVTDLSS